MNWENMILKGLDYNRKEPWFKRGKLESKGFEVVPRQSKIVHVKSTGVLISSRSSWCGIRFCTCHMNI